MVPAALFVVFVALPLSADGGYQDDLMSRRADELPLIVSRQQRGACEVFVPTSATDFQGIEYGSKVGGVEWDDYSVVRERNLPCLLACLPADQV